MHAIFCLVLREASGEGGDPRFVDTVRQHQVEHVGARDRAFGGEVGEIDTERLARDETGRVVRWEIDARDDRVGLGDEFVTEGRADHRGVVEQPVSAGKALRKRREVARDQREFAR